MFRPLLGHLQVLWEKTHPRAIYISMLCQGRGHMPNGRVELKASWDYPYYSFVIFRPYLRETDTLPYIYKYNS